MPKIELTTNQLGLILKVVREAMPKAKKAMTYSLANGMTDYRELSNIENKIQSKPRMMRRSSLG
jgi:hypothetical protein